MSNHWRRHSYHIHGGGESIVDFNIGEVSHLNFYIDTWRKKITFFMYEKCLSITAQKMKFSIKDFFSKRSYLVTFTEEILNEKLHFLCSTSFGFTRHWIFESANTTVKLRRAINLNVHNKESTQFLIISELIKII